jgi:hypothetical protein
VSNGLGGHLFCTGLPIERSGRQIAKSALLANPAARDFDVFGDFAFCLFSDGKSPMMNEFVSW